MRITENDIKYLVTESVNRILSEVSTDMKGAALVKARQELQRLQNLDKQGERYTQKNGQTVNVQSEIKRLKRQIETFRTGIGVDLNYQYGDNSAVRRHEMDMQNVQKEIDKCKSVLGDSNLSDYERGEWTNRLKRYQKMMDAARMDSKAMYDYDSSPTHNEFSLELSGDNDYLLKTPNGNLETSDYGTMRYGDGDRGDQRSLDKFQSQLDAMKGYDDSLSHATDAKIDDLDRVKQNMIDIQNYEKDHDKWEEQDREIKQKQSAYDRSPFFKKWGKKRPEDIPEPKAPEWRRDKNGEFDGYFRNSDPEFYEGKKGDVRKAQKGYRDAYNKKSRNYI